LFSPWYTCSLRNFSLEIKQQLRSYCYLIFSFMCMFCRSLFVLFHLPIVLSVLWFPDSDYPFDIFKLFLHIFG
jgi:hypothetical protein